MKHRLDGQRIRSYRPYTKQADFHAAGVSKRERANLAGNQLGKSFGGAAELSYHLTGNYPDWWKGRRFDRPVRAWAGSDTAETTRDNPQRLLLGLEPDFGTAAIPREAIDFTSMTRRRGVAGAIDRVRIKHASGGWSWLQFKSYDQGRAKWAGETLEVVWFDEEPPEEVYNEGLARTNATKGLVYLTATPLLGMSNVVRRFYPEPDTPDRHLTMMTIDDAEHYTPEERAKIIASYAAHERDARASGIPMMGSGRIFPLAEELIRVQAFVIPREWPQLGALDFGWDHPFAAVNLAYDKDADAVYVTRAHRVREQTPVLHAAALKPWGEWLPWAWPHDGLQHSKDSGKPLAEQYRAQGLKLLTEHARYPDNADGSPGTNGVEAGLFDMLDRMQTGRLKVFDHLHGWFEEYRQYHRKDGQVVKVNDDLLSATRYGIMCLRFAETERAVTPKWLIDARRAGRGASPMAG